MKYKSRRWQDKRKAILARDNYTCQWFKRFGKQYEATHVHHIYPLEFYPEYAMCNWNLISLSTKAHNMMHDRETHEITAIGKILQRKVQREKEEFDKRRTPPS